MDTRRIRKLIELVKETGVGELEVKSGDDSVRITCYPQTSASVVTTHQESVSTAPLSHVPVNSSVEPAPVVDSGYVQKAPMVGTVYLAQSPGAKPFVAVGDRVEEGDALCMIEAMKMFNKIEAECAGVVSARLIENEQPVEYNQSLFIIEPNG